MTDEEWEKRLTELEKEIKRLRHNYDQIYVALRESLRLQSHYAELLNMHDGGQRMTFPTIESWIKRLVETTTIKLKEKLKEKEKRDGDKGKVQTH